MRFAGHFRGNLFNILVMQQVYNSQTLGARIENLSTCKLYCGAAKAHSWHFHGTALSAMRRFEHKRQA